MRERIATCLLTLSAGAWGAPATTISFVDTLYPVLLTAGCQNCHNPDGVSSGTRLHFPEEGASRQRLEAFGKSLVTLVDRKRPEASLLLNKPTNRVKHTGGERIKQGGEQEALLKQWVTYLASLSENEVRQAALYRSSESRSYGDAPAVVLRRLTHQQYANTVRDLLHDPTDVSTHFAPEDFVDGFKNQYQSQSLSPTLIEAYSQEAERLAENAFRRGDSRRLIPCDYSGTKESACRTEFIAGFGLRAFRRPLKPEELARYESIFKREKSFLSGAQAVVEAVLQSPSFLFWMDTTPRAEWKAYATASRLSYFLWNSTPDDALLGAAARGELNAVDGVEKTARKMLADPKARQGLDQFVTEWLRFDRALASARERRTFPMFSRELVVAMTEEAKRFIADLVWNDRNFMDAFRASYGFVNSDLAAVYKVTAPARDFDRVDFPPEQERAGLLGQALFLTLTSKPEDTAPTARGLFVREQFLCQQVPPPPPGVDTNLPPVPEDRPITNRERLAAHTTNKSCSGCHSLIDPLGFGLEKFDAIGVRREKMKLLFYPDVHEAKVPKKEVDLELDLTGEIAGIPNSQFSNSRRLGELLADSDLCQECMVKQVFRYMSGRHETRADAPLIERSRDEFRVSGFRFRELLVSLIKLRMQNRGALMNVITKRARLSRRLFLKGLSWGNAPVIVGVPPLVSMFNGAGTAYAAGKDGGKRIAKRFVFWFNGNGIPERYWIPDATGAAYEMTPCLNPLARLKNDVHVISGLDNSAIVNTAFDGHSTAMSALMSCTRFSGRGPGGPSLDQIVARKIGSETRFRSLQIGVSQESFGGAMQRNMSWAGPERPLPPEEIPHRLFDRLFGAKDTGWIERKRSILDSVREDAALLRKGLPTDDSHRLDEHLSSVRDLERAIASLPPEYRDVAPPGEDFDMKDWPRIAKVQSDLLVYALATGQTRVASYMLTKCQGLARFPWLGHTAARHHDYTHKDGKAPGASGAEGQRILRDICRWHVEEFAYLVGKLKSIPEGDGTVLDNTLAVFVHEHAEANIHKASGMIALVAGSKDRMVLGQHTRSTGTVGDLYLTLTDGVLDAGIGSLPTATKRLPGITA